MWSSPSLLRQFCILSGLCSAQIMLAVSLVVMAEAKQAQGAVFVPKHSLGSQGDG